MKSRDFQTCHGPGQFGRCIQSWRSNLNPYWRIKETKTKNGQISQRHLRKQSPDKNTEYLIMFIFLRLELTIMDFVTVKDNGTSSLEDAPKWPWILFPWMTLGDIPEIFSNWKYFNPILYGLSELQRLNCEKPPNSIWRLKEHFVQYFSTAQF